MIIPVGPNGGDQELLQVYEYFSDTITMYCLTIILLVCLSRWTAMKKVLREMEGSR